MLIIGHYIVAGCWGGACYTAYVLPEHCDLTLDPAKAAATAELLRAHHSLANELALHLGSVET